MLSNPPETFGRAVGRAASGPVATDNSALEAPLYEPARRLTAEERIEMVDRYLAGERAFVLAGTFGVHRSTVADVLVEAGVRRPRLMTDPERLEATQLYEAGLTCAEVGAQLGRSRDAVRRALHVAGVPLRDPRRDY